MRRLAAPSLALLVLALTACGSGDGGATKSTGGYRQAPTPGTSQLTACLQKAGLKVADSGGGLIASGHGDLVRIRVFSAAKDADAFARKQTADATQAGNRVAVYGPNPKPKTVDAIETCLAES